MKRCPSCEQTKPMEAFYRNRSKPDGRTSRCAECEREFQRDRYRENPAPRREARARWVAENPDEERARRRAYQQRNREQIRERQRARRAAKPLAYIENRYGLSVEQYEQLVVDQAGRCAVCGDQPDRMHIDHDHSTGAVRGLLCKSCNLALGFLRDSPEIAKRAADYLQGVPVVSIPLERSA